MPTRIPVHILACSVLFLLVSASCDRRPSVTALSVTDSLAILSKNIAYRTERDAFLRSSPDSPFMRDTVIEFHSTNWYPVNVRYRGLSRLHRYAQPEPILIKGTQGEDRRQLRYGCFEFPVPGPEGAPVTIKLNVYKFTPYDSLRYALYPHLLNVWFTDETTGKETYDVGRYVDVGDEHPDREHLYEIDLNMAYNPYCAYNDTYSCAIPRREDHVSIAIQAGEKKYHQ